jgi:glycosyltransferase involved in cell wall biosynthesis
MNILYICHYFVPELGAPSARVYEMAKRWIQKGHKVTVVTCFPNHPTGIIPDSYRGKLFQREVIDEIEVFRNYVYSTPNKGIIKKTINHLSFMFSSLFFSLPRIGSFDVIIVSSPTFFSVISALVFSKIKSVPFVFEVRDLWPAIFVDLGILKNRHLIAVLEAIEMFLYRQSGKVITVTKSFRNTLIARGIHPEKIDVITNGAEIDFFTPRAKENRIRNEFFLNGKFVVSYTGAHGISHGLQSVLFAAELLQEYKDILFLFVGEGAEKDNLIAIKNERNLRNTIFLPGQKKELMPDVYAASDVCLVPLRSIELFKTFIPSKIFEIMACGRPIIGSVLGEAHDILEEAGCAVLTTPESSEEIARAVKKLYKDRNYGEKLGANGRCFVEKNYSRERMASNYEVILQEMAKGK